MLLGDEREVFHLPLLDLGYKYFHIVRSVHSEHIRLFEAATPVLWKVIEVRLTRMGLVKGYRSIFTLLIEREDLHERPHSLTIFEVNLVSQKL